MECWLDDTEGVGVLPFLPTTLEMLVPYLGWLRANIMLVGERRS